MRPATRTRLAVAALALALVPLLAGCVVFGGVSLGPQQDIIGPYQTEFTACASGSAGCSNLGNSGAPALSGTGQILVAIRIQDTTSIPVPLTSTGPEALVFSPSPSYAAELQRLAPAAPGTHWIGLISQETNYSTTSGPQRFTLKIPYALTRGLDGAPFQGPIMSEGYVGGRVVTPAAPATRPVVCGPSLTSLYDEDPSATNDVWVICHDSLFIGFSAAVEDLGVLSGAAGSGAQGELAAMPFTLRWNGFQASQAPFRLTATTALAGASVAVTPETLVPPANSTTKAVVAVGIPPGARPGSYDLTLSARLANGQSRSAVGRLTVLAGPGNAGPGGGGPSARLRLTTILPRRLSAKAARRRGIAVLIGANKAGIARVQLFQGRAKKPKAAKRVRLKVPGPTRVVLRSRTLVKGPYRIVISADGGRFVRRAVLTR